jgi:meiotically up-regulated gene 157 (Mug157) protein
MYLSEWKKDPYALEVNQFNQTKWTKLKCTNELNFENLVYETKYKRVDVLNIKI